MKSFLFILLFFATSVQASQIKSDLSGNIEAQARKSWNNPEADELGQDWNKTEFYMLYGNLNGKLDFKNSRIETNLFARYTQSSLYQHSNYVAPSIFTFPDKLVARNVIKLEHKKVYDDHTEESVLNKLYYEWDYDEHRFVLGRMYINYGLGEVFNPINPFNQPTALTSISQVAQGNDGMLFTLFVNDKYFVEFYLLGDKNLRGYENQINKTVWAHGEFQATDNLQLNYVIGEDQQRHKVGGQASYQFEAAMLFFQGLYQTEFVNKEPSNNLIDLMVGFDQQLTSKWHIRSEAGYQKRNRFAPPTDFGGRFLPTEYFVALANVYEIHPLVKLSGTFINDIKSGFVYFLARSTFNLSKNTEAELFGYTPLAKGQSVDYEAQKLVTTDLGLALRAFF